MGRVFIAIVAAVGGFLFVTPAAAAWRAVTTAGASTDQAGIVRTADGVLHVAWHRGSDLLHTVVGRDGRVGATTPIQSGWTGFMDPALTVDGGGIRAFWGGIRTTDANDPQRELNTALSADGGRTWALQPGSVVPGGGQAYGSDVSAVALRDGTSLQAWAGTLGTWVHAGLTPATPNVDYMAGQQYGNQPGLAAAAGGQAMMAWFSSAAGPPGVLAQPVGPGGAPAGGVQVMPGTQGLTAGGTLARTPIAARGGDLHVVYPAEGAIRLWRVGAAAATTVARTTGTAQAALAVDARRRVWVVWSDGGFGDKRVLAVRSNPSLTRFGAVVDAGVVAGAHSVYSVDASAQGGALDVLAHVGTGSSSDGATHVTRVRPGLTLRASRGRRSTVFTVLDAGSPVAGATVRAGGRSGRTGATGRVTLRGRYDAARATAPGYAPAAL